MRRLATLALMAALSSVISPSAIQRDIEYGRAGNVSLGMDVRTPAGPGPFPALILVHGGGWVRGDKAWNMAPLFEPLTEAGFASFSISYRLANDFFQFGAAIDDVRLAVQHVRDNAARYNIDPHRIALVGESAGAHLAAMAALQDPKPVAAFVGLYTPTDLEDLARTSPVIPPQIRNALEGSVFGGLLAGHLRSLSPVEHVRPGVPPFLLIHGTSDSVVPYSQSTRMLARMMSAGAACELMTVRNGVHGMRYWDRSPEQAGYRRDMIAWLQKKLQKKLAV